MYGILVLAETISENVKCRRCSPVPHNVNCLILTEVLACHVKEVFLLSWLKRDVVLPELSFDLTVLLVRLLFHVVHRRLVDKLLDLLDCSRCGLNYLNLFFFSVFRLAFVPGI